SSARTLIVPTSNPPVDVFDTAAWASVRLTDRLMRRWTVAPCDVSLICHFVPDCPCAWPFVAASVIACFTAVPRSPSASTLTSCLTDAPGRIRFGSIVWVMTRAELVKHDVTGRPEGEGMQG